jgi:regulation of enolase protein 1 (concanavalin A-like superfamily)
LHKFRFKLFLTFFGVFSVALFSTTNVNAQTGTLPAGWSSADVGSPGLSGTAVSAGDTVTVQGAGDGFGATADQFRFVYRTFSGDIDMSVRLSSLQSANGQAGLMIRESLSASAASALISVSAAQDAAFHARTRAGRKASITTGPRATLPVYLRLVRKGRIVTAYTSTTGSTWALLTSVNLTISSTALIGVAVTSNNPSDLASASFSSSTFGSPLPPTSTLPTPWSSRDIGTPAISGAASAAGGVFTVTGAGVDIWAATDQFQYVYQPVTGDTQIMARVASFQTANGWGKAGVMIRSALTGPAAHASLFATGANGWSFQRRLYDGATSYSNVTAGAAPGWVKLVREGSLLSAYQSGDGATWTLVGTDTVQMPSTIYVGLAVTSHDASATSTATFSNAVVSAPTTSNTPPTVAITTPSAGATFPATSSIAVTAAASDADGTVNGVKFFANAAPIGTATAAPFGITWPNVAAGTYTLTAVATDNGGEASTSPAVLITVTAAPTSVPTRVAFTPPVDYATNVTSCAVQLRRATDPLSATPVASRDLGKPTPVNGEISVDITSLVDPLSPGSYYAVIVAKGPGGSTGSNPSSGFVK